MSTSSDPLQSIHKSLRPCILALEQNDLDKALLLFWQLGPWSQFSWIPKKGSPNSMNLDWLWSCYFDAHWMSSSFAEFSLIQKKLIQTLESQLEWYIYHQPLMDTLQAITTKYHILNQSLQSGQCHASLSELDSKRVQWLLQNVPGPLLTDFRVPMHQLAQNPLKGAADTAILYDVCDMGGRCYTSQSAVHLCTSLLAACYSLQAQPHGATLYSSQPPAKAKSILKSIGFKPLQILNLQPAKLANQYLAELQAAIEGGCDSNQALCQLLKRLQSYHRQNVFNRYGPGSRLALLQRFNLWDWHFGIAQRDVDIGKDALQTQLELIHKTSKPLSCLKQTKKLPRVVHVCSQIFDTSHAPSRIIQRLLSIGDRSRFDYALVVTESLFAREGDYPTSLRTAESSLKRGAGTIQFLEREKIAYLVETPSAGDSLEACSKRLAQRLAPLDIDILVFHGPEPLHHALAAQLKGPVKVLFEHGTLPKTQGFDHAICALEDTLHLPKNRLPPGCNLHILPFFADSRSQWQAKVPFKSDFGLSDDVMIATTISNHLETRLSADFCDTISQILKKCPHVHYMPIGKVKNPQELLNRFDSNVHSQIRFLGPSDTPSNLTRCMDLYFNEFPFGSCYGILDAMASGCAVVSMYDPKGPPQARYGGVYAGLDMAITSLLPKDYVKVACELAHNPLTFFKWSQRSFQNYEWRSNLWAYVHRFENLLEAILKSSQR